MTRLQVEVADFRQAASTLRHDVAEAVRICLDGLSLPSAMVGEDPAGQSWSAAYDPAARATLRATAALINAVSKTSVLLAQSGLNYGRAEASSGGREPLDFGELLRPVPVVAAPHMTRSGGAGNGTPSGWWLVEHTVGLVWPGGHQDQLRAAAGQWRAAAGGLEHIAIEPALAAVAFARDRLPEADDVAVVCRGLNARLDELGRAYRSLADACDAYADHLDECHNAIRDELADLTRDSAITQGAGGVLSVFTFGAAEVPTQAVEAGRIAVTAAKVTSIIEELVRAGRRIATVLEPVHDIAQGINTGLAPLLDARATAAAITNARNVPRVKAHISAESRTEAAAINRLGRVKRPLNAAERRHILGGDRGSGGHRSTSKDPTKSKYPAGWRDAKIIRHVTDIVYSDQTQWYAETGNGDVFTKTGKPAKWRAWEYREGVRIRVIWEPATGRVRSGFPDPETPVNGVAIP